MTLPSNTDLQTLDIAHLGQPFVQVEAKTLGTTSLDVAYLAQPFVAVGPSETPPPPTGLNVWINAGGTWKQATAMWVREGGVWKSVTAVSTRQAGVWKS